FARAAGREVVYDAEHYFDGYKADAEYAIATLRAARAAGATTLTLCDTNGGTLTDELISIIDASRAGLDADPDSDEIVWGIHVHNDAELAVANSLAAVQHGIRHVQGTVNGYGERCGNANLVSILANLSLKTDRQVLPSGRLADLTELSRYVAEIVNITPDDHQPYVGRARRCDAEGRPQLSARRSRDRRERLAAGRVGARRPGQHPTPRRAARTCPGRCRPARAEPADQAARGGRPGIRGRRGVIRAAGQAPPDRLRPALPAG
ncbi:MAG: hypothetical protein E6I45_13280, partial [Chloroflexi bacterium]